MNQQNIIPPLGLVKHPLCEAALGKQPVQHLIPGESRAQLRRLFHLLLQFIIDRRIHRLIVVLTLPGEYLLLLVIHRHHVDLRIAVDVTRPVGADAGGHEVHCLAPAQGGKDIFADVLVGEGNKFLNKVLLQLVQNDLLIVQFQFPLVGIDITKPEADEII